MDLENFAKLRGLNQAYIASNSGFIDSLLNSDQGAEIRNTVFTKRLQFDTTPELYAEVENICQLLGCSKREFLELAVLHGLDKAEQVFGAAFKDATGREFGTVEGD